MILLKKENRSYLLVFVVCLLIMIYGILDILDIIDQIGRILFIPDYISHYFLENDNPALRSITPTLINYTSHVLTNMYCYFDEIVAFGLKYFQIIIPLFAVVPAIEFYRYFHSVHQMQISKENHYRKYIFSQIIGNSVKLALSVFCAYFIFLLVVQLISDPTINENDVAKFFLLDIFGEQFILKYKFLYYFVEGSIRFFLIPFVYSCLAQSAVVCFDHLKEVVATPIVYYYLLTFIGYGFAVFRNNLYIYFSPAVIMSNGSFTNFNSLLLLIVNMIPLVIGIGIIYWRTRYVEI